MASIQKGREGREKFGSLKGKKGKETKSSSTNREKARNKPIMMTLQCVVLPLVESELTPLARTRWSRRRSSRSGISR